MNARSRRDSLRAALIGLGCAWSAGAAWSAPEPFPTARPATRLQAVAALSSGAALPHGCVTPVAGGSTAPTRRALALLQADRPLAGERRLVVAEGLVVRFATDRAALDRVEGADGDADGIPDLVEAAAAGSVAARDLLMRRFDFPNPGPVEIVLARLGSGAEGVLATARDGHRIALIDPTLRGGVDAVRRAAAHQTAHAVAEASAPGVPSPWLEAFATWATLEIEPRDERSLALLSARHGRLDVGLEPVSLDDAAGNALWWMFLEEAYGPTTLRIAMDELAKPGSALKAFDRALRRGAGSGFSEAIREFHVWAVLTGDRDDRRHFSIGAKLPSPPMAQRVEGLPAVSILGEPLLGPAGLAHVSLRPADERGGVLVRFEAEPGARLGADLLLVRSDGALRRVPIDLDGAGRGEAALPLQGVREILLLARNLDGEESPSRRFSWFATADPTYPWEPGAVTANALTEGGVQISWETSSEAGVLGFNVLRRREGDPSPVRVNPVWVPAVGDRGTSAQYAFADAGALPGVTYEYRVEAITPLGLSAISDAALATPGR